MPGADPAFLMRVPNSEVFLLDLRKQGFSKFYEGLRSATQFPIITRNPFI